MDKASLKAARKRLGMTQAQLATKLGYSQNSVWNWENGFDVPKVVELAMRALENGRTPDNPTCLDTDR